MLSRGRTGEEEWQWEPRGSLEGLGASVFTPNKMALPPVWTGV